MTLLLTFVAGLALVRIATGRSGGVIHGSTGRRETVPGSIDELVVCC